MAADTTNPYVSAQSAFNNATGVTLTETTTPIDYSGIGFPSGPLSSLSANKYSSSSFTYPRDLGSLPKLHSVQFTAFEIDPVTYQEFKDYVVSAAKTGADAAVNAYNNITDTNTKIIEELKTTASNIKTGVNDLLAGNVNLGGKFSAKPRTKTTPGDTITLYMPETAEFSYNAKYDSISLMDAAASVPLVGGVARAIQSTLQNQAAKLLMNSAGYVFNPQEQILFEGIDFRTYQMSFTFTPYSREEAAEVTSIIKSFRRNAAPTIVTNLAGFFFIPPSVFQISYLYNGQENPNINKVKTSVLTDVTVNYAPNGWSAHDDGSPVQTTMTLSFKEIELVDSAAIQEGY